MTGEQNQPTTEVTQAVADSNAATVASLSTIVSTSQEAGEAVAGESAAVATAMASSAAYGTQEASKSADVQPVSASSMPSATSAVSAGQVDAPAVAQPGEPVANGSGNSDQPSTSDASATLSIAASTSSAEALAFSTSDTTNTPASSSNASIPVNSAADATMADVGEQAEQQPETEHPAKPHIRGFLRKIEAGEAIVLADVEAVLRRLEEAL
ncbi:hypothetical protein [Burkholderia gladioli]|uniref:hypothetical protein n=1 Tax=Burkholderia gladioli TaxID=28095 RepID=UPI000CFED432|nr:hypothetical protein [Burkholderia gladioli]PRG49700.1 hypothetical protein C6V06_23565 [Burkholderia gladioli]